jgi:hypothetical protein
MCNHLERASVDGQRGRRLAQDGKERRIEAEAALQRVQHGTLEAGSSDDMSARGPRTSTHTTAWITDGSLA